VPRNCRCKRDTYLYELRDKGKVVYRGITNDVERRIREHARDGKRFTTYWYSAAPSCRKSAFKYEREKAFTITNMVTERDRDITEHYNVIKQSLFRFFLPLERLNPQFW